MDKVSYEEIISILVMFGRADLVHEFKDNVKIDPDYLPSAFRQAKFTRRDSLSNSEGSATCYRYYEMGINEDRFRSLKYFF